MLNTFKNKLDLHSMNMNDALRQENMRLHLMNSELEVRLLELAGQVYYIYI